MGSFRAVVIEKGEGGQSVAFRPFDDSGLMDGDVTVRVTHSTLNYKDGLALTGKAPVVRRFPMIPGIDFAGTVESSGDPDFKPGDAVVLNGWGLGETHLGGYARAGAGEGRLAGPAARRASARARPWRSARRATRRCWHCSRSSARPRPRPRAGRRHRRRGRRRLGRDRTAREGRLARHRLDRADGRGRLPQGPRRRRDHRPRRAVRPRAAARQGALGGGRRLRRLDTRSPTCWP